MLLCYQYTCRNVAALGTFARFVISPETCQTHEILPRKRFERCDHGRLSCKPGETVVHRPLSVQRNWSGRPDAGFWVFSGPRLDKVPDPSWSLLRPRRAKGPSEGPSDFGMLKHHLRAELPYPPAVSGRTSDVTNRNWPRLMLYDCHALAALQQEPKESDKLVMQRRRGLDASMECPPFCMLKAPMEKLQPEPRLSMQIVTCRKALSYTGTSCPSKGLHFWCRVYPIVTLTAQRGRSHIIGIGQNVFRPSPSPILSRGYSNRFEQL